MPFPFLSRFAARSSVKAKTLGIQNKVMFHSLNAGRNLGTALWFDWHPQKTSEIFTFWLLRTFSHPATTTHPWRKEHKSGVSLNSDVLKKTLHHPLLRRAATHRPLSNESPHQRSWSWFEDPPESWALHRRSYQLTRGPFFFFFWKAAKFITARSPQSDSGLLCSRCDVAQPKSAHKQRTEIDRIEGWPICWRNHLCAPLTSGM